MNFYLFVISLHISNHYMLFIIIFYLLLVSSLIFKYRPIFYERSYVFRFLLFFARVQLFVLCWAANFFTNIHRCKGVNNCRHVHVTITYCSMDVMTLTNKKFVVSIIHYALNWNIPVPIISLNCAVCLLYVC